MDATQRPIQVNIVDSTTDGDEPDIIVISDSESDTDSDISNSELIKIFFQSETEDEDFLSSEESNNEDQMDTSSGSKDNNIDERPSKQKPMPRLIPIANTDGKSPKSQNLKNVE